MDQRIFLLLVQDALVNGAIYILLAVSIIAVFTTTRVVLFFQGELIAFSALTYIMLARGGMPGSIYILLTVSVASAVIEIVRSRRDLSARLLARVIAVDIVYPALLFFLLKVPAVREQGPIVDSLLTLAIMAPLGPAIYRIAFRPAADASILTLLMISMGCHMMLLAFGLYTLGSEGARARPLISGRLAIGDFVMPYDRILVVVVMIAVVAALWSFFRFTMTGKSLQASAVNRVGAQLVGIPVSGTGQVAFAVSSILGAVAGILLAPTATIYYDSGFVISLKGFVAAVLAGLAGYPVAVVGALLVSLTESFSAFWMSAFKEVIVFTVILPALFWLSLRTPHVEDEHE